MRYRIKDYSVVTSGGYIQISIPEPKGIFDGVPSATMDEANKRKVVEAVRLIADETKGGYVLMSTGQKSTLTFAAKSSGRIHLAFTFASLIATADGDEDDLAAIAALQALPEGTTVTDQFTIEMDWGDEPTGLSGGDDAHNLAAFFNITEATEYTALTPAEAIAIARDCQYNVMGTDWPIPTWLPTGVTEAQVESAAEGLGIPYHEPTQTA